MEQKYRPKQQSPQDLIQKPCRFGEKCKFFKENTCKYLHSPSPKPESPEKPKNFTNNIQNKQVEYNEHQKKPNQSLKDFYLNMLQKNEQITQKAHYIESLQPGYSINPGQVDNFYSEAYEKEISNIAELQIKNKTVKIGIDFGNVICGSDPNANQADEDTMFGENYLQVNPIPDAFKGVKFLTDKFGSDNVYIVSKAKQKMQGKSLNWMQHKDFYNLTGILPKNLIFCLERNDKAQICYDNGISYFIDDKMDVLNKMDDKIMKFLFPTQKKKNYPKGQYLKHVEGWQHLIDIFEKIQKQ